MFKLDFSCTVLYITDPIIIGIFYDETKYKKETMRKQRVQGL